MSDSSEKLGFIHRFIPAGDGSGPPMLLLHGTGGDENDLLPVGKRVAPGAALLSPRGKALENDMPRYFRRVAEGAWDIDDFKQRTAELAEFVRNARAEYKLAKPIALGYSNGANIAWSLLLHDPELLAGAILMRAMLPFDPRPLPDLSGVPVLLLAGASDPLVPHEQAGLLAALLGEAGADVTYELLPAGHGLSEYDLTFAKRWLVARR
jgi:phospholipase/carboxylesterase